MKFTKRLLTIALSMSMVMPLCATAYAAQTVTNLSATIKANATDSSLYDVTVTFSVADSSKQMSLLLTGPNTDNNLDDNDIVHINQFGKNEPDEAVIVSGSGTCTFSVTKARMEVAGATVNESEGTTTLRVSMGADDATESISVAATYDKPTSTTVPVTGVELGDDSIDLTVGDTQTLVAVVKPADATNKNVTWSSSEPNVATVDATGKVTAVAPGQATITVTTVDGNKTDTCVVTVSAEEVPAEAITLNKPETTLAVGKTETLTATLTPSNATSEVLWVSSDTEVATVDANGLVTAVAVGEPATITAFIDANGDGALDDGDTIRATCTVRVEAAPDELLGDIDGNGTVDIDDAILLFQHSVLPDIYQIEYKGNIDFDKNGAVDIDDAILLFQYSVLPDIYPIG